MPLTLQSTPPDPLLERRLVYLSVIRCVTVTLLLGSAIILNINNVEGLQHPTYLGLNIIIGASYVFTALIFLLLRYTRRVVLSTHLSLAFDALSASGLILLTGQLGSPFIFLLIIVSLFGGFILGRAGGLAAASYCTLGLAVVLLSHQGLLDVRFLTAWKPDWDDSPFYRGITLTAAFYAAGLLSGLLAERVQRTEQALATSEDNLARLERFHQRVLESLGSGLITTDARATITYANPAACAILGLDASDIVGASLDDHGLTAPPGGEDEELRWESLYRVSSDQSLRVLGLTASPFPDQGQPSSPGQIITFKDLTELRRAEQRLKERQRLATLGRFAASVSHEIRNPLAAISGSVEMLSSAQKPDSEDAVLMEITLREIDRLNSLVKSILNYARPKHQRRSSVDLCELIRDSASLFSKDHGSQAITLELDLPEALPCKVPEETVRQALWNLWRNAAEAMDAAGCIHTRLEREHHTLFITITDEGPGIPAEHREKIFEPFFTTKPSGTGLGLATIFQLITEQDGSLALLSSSDQGSVFEIQLPYQPPEIALASTLSSGAPA